MNAPSHVAVTGAGGFIGSGLTRALARRGAVVHALVGAPDDVVNEPPDVVRAIRGDVADADVLRSLVERCDTVVHLAGPPSVGASFEDPQRYVHAHVAGTTNVLEACRAANVRRLVYISSAEIYGNAGLAPVDESSPPDPRSPYAASKLAAEEMIRAFLHFSEFTACILRPFSVYGPRQSSYSLIQTIVRQARSGDAIRLADLKPVRDYCYLDDVLDAIVAACTAPIDDLEICNIGSGVGTSVRDLAQAILAQLGRAVSIAQNGTVGRPPRAEIYALVANVDRAKRVLSWSARTSLDEGLRRVIESDHA